MSKIHNKYLKPLWQTLFFITIVAVLVNVHSCANPGSGPQGGPRDTIAPVILNSVPEPLQTNFAGKEIILTFDEYVVVDNLSGKMIISPPLAEKPTVKLKGKSIIIKLNEALDPGRTYSVDFADGIKDYNEGNKIDGFRMLFSTYDQIDTLIISGYLLDAFNLEPLENATALLYTINEDSLFSTTRPDYIAKTDKKGYFMFDNLTTGSYRLYGIINTDNKLFYSQKTEQIAFFDTLLIPNAKHITTIDTIYTETDTTLTSKGYTEFEPSEIISYLFLPDFYKQFLVGSRRETEDFMLLVFNEQLCDSFKIELLGVENTDSLIYKELGRNRDTLSIWICDPGLVKTDSLKIAINYTVSDSAQNFITKADTLKMNFKKPKEKERSPSIVKEEELPVLFDFAINATGNFDLNKKVKITAPLPVNKITKEFVQLSVVVNDSTFEAVSFDLIANSKREYELDFEMKEETNYVIKIDSAAITSLTGLHNKVFEKKFKTQKLEYYGSVIIELKGSNSPGIVQLLKNSKDEEVLYEVFSNENENTIVFNFLKPAKYRIKFIEDLNQNKKWDSGILDQKIQPEKVFYFSKIIEVKSNWDIKETWDILPHTQFLKDFNEADKEKSK